MRTFIAIEIPLEIRKKVIDFINMVRTVQPIKWVEFENLHITLKFLGEVSEDRVKRVIESVESVMKGIKPFAVSFEGLGCFPDPRYPRVVWIGVKEGAGEISVLQQHIDQALLATGFPVEKKFHPHLTIGRVKVRCDLSNILGKEFKSEPYTVKSITLFKSTLTPKGPIYETVRVFNF